MHTYTVDVSKRDQINGAAARVKKEVGTVGILVSRVRNTDRLFIILSCYLARSSTHILSCPLKHPESERNEETAAHNSSSIGEKIQVDSAEWYDKSRAIWLFTALSSIITASWAHTISRNEL